MINYPNINPDFINIYGITIKWYGVCHVLALLLFYWRAQITKPNSLANEQLYDLLCYVCLGGLWGGKIGYIIFYMPSEIIEDPLAILRFWLPGRSFHGGLLGVIIALYIYAKVTKQIFWEVADFIAPIVPLGLALGRIGNFINGELWGRITNVPWGMVFHHVDSFPRHPSQIYEILLEGIVLFMILKNIKKNSSLWFLILYAIFRILIENYREPDIQIGLINGLTMGQILSIPMLVIGVYLLFVRKLST